METDSRHRTFRRRWLHARKAPRSHRAYEPERIGITHPVFDGILVKEDAILQELSNALSAKGLDLGLIMMELHPGSKPEDYAWLQEQPREQYDQGSTYEELREALIYLHHNVLVRYLDRLDAILNP